MRVQFFGLNEEEKERVLAIEDLYPEHVSSMEIISSFGGEIAVELIIQAVPAVLSSIASVASIILTIKNGKDKKGDHDEERSQPAIIVISNDGNQININNSKELESLIEH